MKKRDVLAGMLVFVSVPLLGLAGIFAFFAIDRTRIVAAASPTVVRFFAATTAGDVAAATSCLSTSAAQRVAGRIAAEPALYRVKEVSDFLAVEIVHHHPIVIGARLTLADGQIKYGRFRLYFGETSWVIDAYRIEDAPPSRPKQSESGDH